MFDVNDEKIKQNAAKLLRDHAPPFKRFGKSAVMLSVPEIADYLMVNGNLTDKQYKDRICSILRGHEGLTISVDDFFLIAWVTGIPLVQVFSSVTSLSEELSLELLKRIAYPSSQAKNFSKPQSKGKSSESNVVDFHHLLERSQDKRRLTKVFLEMSRLKSEQLRIVESAVKLLNSDQETRVDSHQV